MVAAVLQKKYESSVERLVQQSNKNMVYKSVAERTDLWQELERLSRLDISILIIDLDMALDDKNALQAVKNYRILKDSTRIIVICQNRRYGDNTVSQLVKLGIYDIVLNDNDYENTLKRALFERTPYSKAVRWSIEEDIKEEKNKIITEKLIGSVTIGVGSISAGCGATHIAVAMAEFLRKKGRTAVVELNGENPQLSKLVQIYKTYSIENIQGDIYNNDIGFCMGGIDFYPYNELNMAEIIKRDYQYILFDCGVVNSQENEIYRCNVKILNVKSHIWENSQLLEFFKAEKNFATWNIYSGFADKECIEYIRFNLNIDKVFSIPKLSLFKENKEICCIFENTMENYVTKKKKGFWLK